MSERNTEGAGHLAIADFALLVDLVHEAHSARSVEEFPRVAIDVVTRAVQADVTSFNDVDASTGTLRFVMQPPDATDGVPDAQATFERLAPAHHPMMRHALATGDGSARRLSDLLTPAELHANPLYVHLYRPLGLEHQIAIMLPALAPRVVALALFRRPGSGDFDERDRVMLDELRPHLAQSYVLVSEREALVRLVEHGGSIDDPGRHVVLLTDPPRDVTPGALDALRHAYREPAAGHGLPEAVTAWIAAQRRRFDDASSAAVLEPLLADDGDRSLLVRLVPRDLAPDALIAEPLGAGGDLGSVLRLLGLTRRESEVLELVASGATNAQVARELGMAAATAKKHLEHVYRKLGVHGRMQAVALARDLAARGLRSTS